MKRIGITLLVSVLLYYFGGRLPFIQSIHPNNVVPVIINKPLTADTTIWHMAIFNNEGALFIFEKAVPHQLNHDDSITLMKETFNECLQAKIKGSTGLAYN